MDLLAEYDREMREHVRIDDPVVRVVREDPVVRLVGPTASAGENAVVFSRLEDSTADAVIARELAYFRGRDFEWKHFDHDGPPDLAERLARAGFERGDSETLMVLEVGGAAEGVSGVDVRRVGEAELGDLVAVQQAVWGDLPWLEASLRREMEHAPGTTALYAAYDGGAAVATGWIRFGTLFATLHGGATRPSHRGRGLYRALLERRREDARARGIRWLTADATEMSRPLLERSGFRAVGRTTPFVFRFRSPSGAPGPGTPPGR